MRCAAGGGRRCDSPGANVEAGTPSDAGSDCVFVRPICGDYDSGAGCPAVAAATLSSPMVTGAEGGPLAPGQDATVSVVLTASTTSIDYPCVGFAADNPGVSFGLADAGGPTSSTDPAFLRSYALLAGTMSGASMPVHFAASIPHGTVIRFAAWADSLNSACGNGAKIEWDVTMP